MPNSNPEVKGYDSPGRGGFLLLYAAERSVRLAAVDDLKASHFFRNLPPEELRRLAADARTLTFAAGQEIFKEGDPGNGIYLIKSGRVQISALLGNGERHVFSRLNPGDVFGEMTLLDDQPRSATASAETECVLHFIPREPLVETLKRVPDLVVTLVREISDRLREFNHQYVSKMIQAEQMSVVGRFASSIIHDLKNPLTIIAMAARTAGREDATAEARQVAEQRINRQVDRITHLVNDILEFVRGTPAQVALCRTHYGDFLDAALRELRPEIEPKLTALKVEEPLPDVYLQLNPKRILRVLVNLISNGVDAMPKGGTITLRCRTEDGHLVTEIEDQGPGISPEIEARLFEAFATFGKAKGTGLGLAICQRIVNEHGGRIAARNRERGGAVFSFSLPLPKA